MTDWNHAMTDKIMAFLMAELASNKATLEQKMPAGIRASGETVARYTLRRGRSLRRLELVLAAMADTLPEREA